MGSLILIMILVLLDTSEANKPKSTGTSSYAPVLPSSLKNADWIPNKGRRIESRELFKNLHKGSLCKTSYFLSNSYCSKISKCCGGQRCLFLKS